MSSFYRSSDEYVSCCVKKPERHVTVVSHCSRLIDPNRRGLTTPSTMICFKNGKPYKYLGTTKLVELKGMNERVISYPFQLNILNVVKFVRNDVELHLSIG